MIDLGKIKQGERGTLAVPWEFPDSLASPSSIAGASLTAVMRNLDTNDVTAVTGTLTATGPLAATWALSDGDSGTDGNYLVTFRADVSGVLTYTLNAMLVIEANPAATATQNPLLVGIPPADAAWVAAGRGQVPDGDDIATRDGDGTAGELMISDADGNAVRAGYAADTAATAGSVVRRRENGGIVIENQNAIIGDDSTAIFAIAGVFGVAVQGTGDIAIEGKGSTIGLKGVSSSGSAASFGLESGLPPVYAEKSLIRSSDGVLRFVGPDAATNRAAQRTELGLGTAATTDADDYDPAGSAAAVAAAAAPLTPDINSVSNNYTLAMTDSGNVVASTAATPIAITVPLNSTIAFDVGTVVVIQQHGAGQVVIAGAPGVMVYSLGNAGATAGQYAASVLRKIGTDNWLLAHDLSDFGPTAIANLAMWFDASKISGLSDGNTIGTWNDSSGNSRNATSAAGPTYKTAVINGLPVARFNGSSNYLATATTPALAQPNTIFVVAKFSNAWTGDGTMFDSTTALGQVFEIYPLDTKAYQIYAGSGVNSATTKTSQAFRIFEITFNGASSSVIVDGTSVVTGNAGASGIAGLRIGSRGNNTKWLNGDIAELLVFNVNLSSANRALIRAYLYQKYARGLRLVCDGDSLCYGTGSTGGQTFPVQAAALLGKTAINVGIPGKNITSVRDETGTLTYGGVQNDIAVFFVGTADLGSGADAAVLWPILLTAIQRYIAAGYSKLVVCTLPDSQTPTNPADYETQRQTFNTYIRDNAATYGYVVADLGADSRIGDEGDAYDTTYFDSDKVHMNNTGYGVVAEIVVDAINNG